MRIRCLSFHAGYACRHRGECCRAPWDIDVEPTLVEALRTGRFVPARSTPLALVTGEDGALTVPRSSAGDCGYHIGGRCSVHAAGSETMLPSACRHFPRVFLRDARGCLLTLSHYCPTAAAMLFDEDHAFAVVEAPKPLALDEPIEGLDARTALPPLVRPGMLAGIEGYAAWEEAVVRTFVNAPDTDAAFASW